jgi:hypothetical protein
MTAPGRTVVIVGQDLKPRAVGLGGPRAPGRRLPASHPVRGTKRDSRTVLDRCRAPARKMPESAGESALAFRTT